MEINLSADELREEILNISYIVEHTPEVIKGMDKNFWMFNALLSLYEMSQKYNQSSFPEFPEGSDPWCEAERMVKMHRFVDNYVMEREKIERVYFSGVWIALGGLFIKPEVMASYFDPKIKGKQYLRPEEELGFPEGFEWTTIQTLSNGYGFVLKKEKIVPDYINRHFQWEFLYL